MELLKQMCESHAPPGYEDEMIKLMKKEFERVGASVELDKLGNVIAKKGEGKPIVMITAHMDEVGFVVKHIDKEGFIWFIPIGGLYDPTIYNERVVLHGKEKVYGVIGSKPPHIMEEEELKKLPKWKSMFIDVGASNKKEVEKLGIRVGTPITFDREFKQLNENVVTGKAMDDRVGCRVLVDVMERIKDFKGTLYAVATVQEEVGLKGARVSAYRIKPDVAFVIDVGFAKSPGSEEKEIDTELGKGPIITYVEAKGAGLISDPYLTKWLIEVAKKEKVPYQVDVTAGGMTDGAVIAITGEGVPCVSIGVPCRYIHSPVEVVDMRDVRNTSKLLIKAIERGVPEVFPI
mgnify:CR=1 FL=1